MTRFRFSLENVLGLRRTQLELEEARFQQQAAAIAALKRSRTEVQQSGMLAENAVRSWTTIAGGDLAALDAYRSQVSRQDRQIVARLVQCEQELTEQRGSMLEARRRVRLLERLKERRHTEWRAAEDQEVEQAASESYLARWTREH